MVVEAVVVQPLPACSQHQSFLPSDHVACDTQFGNPASQLNNAEVTVPAIVVEQPRPPCWQHHAFLGPDHARTQSAKPTSQSYGSFSWFDLAVAPTEVDGQARWACRQHHDFFGKDHARNELANPASQSYEMGPVVVRSVDVCFSHPM